VQILTREQAQAALNALRATSIYPQVVVLLTTGIRRGELMGLQWGDINFDMGKLSIKRAVEKTKTHGLRIKAPKTKNGFRTISLPGTLEVLKQHRSRQPSPARSGAKRVPISPFVHVCMLAAPSHREWKYSRTMKCWRRGSL
jgi:integrase